VLIALCLLFDLNLNAPCVKRLRINRVKHLLRNIWRSFLSNKEGLSQKDLLPLLKAIGYNAMLSSLPFFVRIYFCFSLLSLTLFMFNRFLAPTIYPQHQRYVFSYHSCYTLVLVDYILFLASVCRQRHSHHFIGG